MKICHHSDGAVTLGIKLFKRLCVKFLFHREGSYVSLKEARVARSIWNSSSFYFSCEPKNRA